MALTPVVQNKIAHLLMMKHNPPGNKCTSPYNGQPRLRSVSSLFFISLLAPSHVYLISCCHIVYTLLDMEFTTGLHTIKIVLAALSNTSSCVNSYNKYHGKRVFATKILYTRWKIGGY